MPVKNKLTSDQLFEKAKVFQYENYLLNDLDKRIIDELLYGNHHIVKDYLFPFIYYGFAPIELKREYFTYIGGTDKGAGMESLIDLSEAKNQEIAKLFEVSKLNKKHKLIVLFNLYHKFELDISKIAKVLNTSSSSLSHHCFNFLNLGKINSLKRSNKIYYRLRHDEDFPKNEDTPIGVAEGGSPEGADRPSGL